MAKKSQWALIGKRKVELSNLEKILFPDDQIVKAEVTGAGSLSLRGYATSLDAVISGPGSINGFNCPLESAKVKVSGSGLCELNVTNNIDALVLGNGQIKHKGNTKTATKKIYGAGTVDRAY